MDNDSSENRKPDGARVYKQGGILIRNFLSILFLIFLAFASWSDLRQRRIPDTVSAAVALTGTAAVWIMPEIGAGQRVAGMLAVSAPVFLITMIKPGAFGGGDIKLLAAGGLFLGVRLSWRAFVIAMAAAGIYSVFLVIKGKSGKEKFALGPFLCMGMALSLFWGEFLWN